jgi:N-formylglutamate amidohydrolase
MINVCSAHKGSSPLLISVPHDGCHIPPDIMDRMTPAGAAVPDTDWHVAELYGFARDFGAHFLVANYSRYVIDLNRSPADKNLYPGQVATGLCPTQTFAGENIYAEGGVSDREKAARIADYWRPYHNQLAATLAAIRDQYGYALLWDAHSIPSRVPRLFDGALPELNIGTNAGKSCAAGIESAVAAVAEASDYASVVNQRFKGGYITRHYGRPAAGVQALQLEIAQRAYMNEESGVFDAAKASNLRTMLEKMLRAFIDAAG